jgi:hypothetical protein
MRMIPPKLVEPPCETIAAIATSIKPTNIIKKPRTKGVRNFRGVSSLDGSAASRVCATAFSSITWTGNAAL